MRIVFSAKQDQNQTSRFLDSRNQRLHPDALRHIDGLISDVAGCGHSIAEPHGYGLVYIARTCAHEYLECLSVSHGRWSILANAPENVVPDIPPPRTDGGYPRSIVGGAGDHLYDLACSITCDTWTSALWGAHPVTATERGQ